MELPSGTVTFLFTDVEGSTRLLHEHGERYADLLAEHRRLLREAFGRHGGVEVDTQGDAFFYAFSRASDALAAAEDGRRALERTPPVRVRMGIHTGEPQLTEEGYVGLDVQKAARIAAAGHGGQVIVSEQTARLAAGDALLDLGLHRLKDLSAPERLYQLGEGEFPPARTLHRTNLPVPANPLVGRKKELADVLRLLTGDGARAVTVGGPGGIGKTRFAIAAAGEATEAFPDGVWFVDLAPLRDPALVWPTVARAVAADDELVRHLADARCLLLLDNFEQVVEAATDAARLLAACPGVRLLVTSREPLRISGEHEYGLRPLPESPAVELFRQRAEAVAADVEVDYGTAAEICGRLDGLPLAIELAAARVRVFDPETLLERLDERLPLLVTRARNLPERQRTLQGTIGWSYELLSAEEQRLFRRLGAFARGATLEAVEAVTGGDVDLLESLVDKSLVRRRGDRFVMLETILEFARTRLDESGEAEEVRSRHAGFFLRLMKSANLSAGRLDPRRPMAVEIAFAEQDNIRAALGWAAASGRTALALELAEAVEAFWVLSDPHEGMRWFEALFAHADVGAVQPEVRADALRAYAAAADIAGVDELAVDLYEQSLAEFTRLGDDDGRAKLLHRVGIQAMRRGDLERARALVRESHDLHLAYEDPLERDWGLTQTTGTLGAIARDAADHELAYELAMEATELARRVGNEWWTAGMLAELAALELAAERVDDADAHAREALRTAIEQRDRAGRVFGVGLLAGVAALRGDVERAARLWGAVEDEQSVAPLGGWRRHRAAVEERVLRLAGPELEQALAEGRELSLDEAAEHALRG
ncbi:MAG: adenylate/guanylate cyclase domain-containing protein [Thermoleophilia bacterium]|nr:adenylate/guanylate cyclase domain-containing protein [Thermoleophilia bacterium]